MTPLRVLGRSCFHSFCRAFSVRLILRPPLPFKCPQTFLSGSRESFCEVAVEVYKLLHPFPGIYIEPSFWIPRRQAANMVHLSSVRRDSEIQAPIVDGINKLNFLPGVDEVSDSIHTSVYGSSFAAQDLPKHVMPDKEMPKDVAYRLIKDDLTLDGNREYLSCGLCILDSD